MRLPIRLLPLVLVAAAVPVAACSSPSSTAAAAKAAAAPAAPGAAASASASASRSAAAAAIASSMDAAIASSMASAAASSAAPASPTKVEFIVKGSAPEGIDITYGPAGSDFSGPGTLNGTVTESVPFDGTASYYSLNAQLQGGGNITCKIVVTGPGDQPLTVSHGAASGDYNICSAQAAPDDGTGTSWENEN